MKQTLIVLYFWDVNLGECRIKIPLTSSLERLLTLIYKLPPGVMRN